MKAKNNTGIVPCSLTNIQVTYEYKMEYEKNDYEAEISWIL